MTDITTPALPARKASTLSLRKVLGFMHLWVGLIFSIPFAAIGLTGSLWMLVRDMPAAIEPSTAPAHTVAEYIAAATAVAPAGMRPAAFEAPLSDKPAAVRFTAGGGRGGEGAGARPAGPPGQGPRITVDPASLTPTVAPPPNNGFARLMHDIHGNLMINGGIGRPLVGWLGVFMTGLGLTGIIIWWPKRGQWKRALKIKLSGGLLRAVYDLHRFFGICTLIVFMMVCISGVYIVFPQAVNAIGNAGPQARDTRNQAPMPVTPIDGETALDADAAVELARGAVADGLLRTVTMPGNPRQPYRVAFSKPGDQLGAPLVTIAVDPWAKTVMDVRDPDAYAANDKFLVWQRALHSGSGLGMGWWVLVFISGLLPPLFAVTGITMWWMRRKVRG
jgi:uncharacterized iron-regulated membrane protein